MRSDASRRAWLCAALSVLLISYAPAGLCDTAPVFVRAWGSTGSGDGQFLSPVRIAVDAAGNVFVIDHDNCRIQKFSSSGEFLTKWGSCGDEFFHNATGIAVGRDGNVYVADIGVAGAILKFDGRGSVLARWSIGNRGARFVSVDDQGYVYLASGFPPWLEQYAPNGQLVAAWGLLGNDDAMVHDIAIGSGDMLYISKPFDRSYVYPIEVRNSDGVYLFGFGLHGLEAGMLDNPTGLGSDELDNIFVTDPSAGRIVEFDSQGQYLTQWGKLGSGDGEFSYCSDVAVGPGGNIYVSDLYTNRILQFQAKAVITLVVSWGSVKATYR